MYVTRRLSFYKNSPPSLSCPPEGPNSGYLVIQDDESLTPSCFGLCKSDKIDDLPLPSNKIVWAGYGSDDDEFFAIPVINQPLSANQYYAIKALGSHRGEAYESSRGSYNKDVKPRPLDPEDEYQQFEFNKTTPALLAKSVAPGSHPPRFLSTSNGLNITVLNVFGDFIVEEANGLNSALRTRLPDFDFPITRKFTEPVCVGKWYCPFMFIHEGNVKDQVKKSVYYEVKLEQWWERIFTSESGYTQGNKVMMDVVVPTQMVAIQGRAAVRVEGNTNSKVVWFRTIGRTGGELSVGLSSLVMERMIWEVQRFGWMNGNGKDNKVRVVREEEYGGIGWWSRLGCYVLVERFVIKRMDGSLILTYDFKNTRQIKTKWHYLTRIHQTPKY